jgi:hypothetical protein
MWDRSMLGMTGAELEVHEALRALERAVECGDLGEETRQALRGAIAALRRELREAWDRPVEAPAGSRAAR